MILVYRNFHFLFDFYATARWPSLLLLFLFILFIVKKTYVAASRCFPNI